MSNWGRKKVQTVVKSVCFTYAIIIHGEKPRMKYHKPARGIDQCPKKDATANVQPDLQDETKSGWFQT